MAVVIFKAVEKCNSNCIYCDVIKKQQHAIMNFDLLKLIFIRMNEYLENNPAEDITFTWHGGEVCLLGADYFKTAIALQDEFCSKTKHRIKHLVQSNLTLIDQEILDQFIRMGIQQIGSSFEPIPHIRGFGKERDSDTYNRKFIEGVKLLNRNNISWGMIYVVHRLSLKSPLDIFYFLTNLNPKSHPNFNQVKLYKDDRHNLEITGEEYAEFLGAIFPVWLRNRDRYPNVQPFADLYNIIKNGNMTLVCEASGNCTYRWIYIGPEGETSHCGRTGDYSVLSYGNIRDFTFEQIMKHPMRRQLADRQTVLAEKFCADCRYWGICHGGCPLDAFMTRGRFDATATKCETMKLFMKKYFEPLTGLSVDYSIRKSLQTAGSN